VLVFLPAAAGALVVAADFGSGANRFGLFDGIRRLADEVAALSGSAAALGGALVPVEVPPKALVDWCIVCWGTLRRKFSKAIKLEALRKMLWQISVLMLIISSSKIL